MSDKLKNGWTRVAFGDVIRQVRDRVDPEESDLERYVAGEHMDSGDLKIRRWGLIGDGYLGPAFHMLFKPGHVLYGSRRTYLRKVALADFEGVTANTTFVLESKDPKVLLPELLPFIMQTEAFHAHSIKQSKGSVNPYINFSDLTWYEFALPPLDEQRRIAEVMEAYRGVCESAKTLLNAARTVHRSLRATLFKTVHGNRETVPSIMSAKQDWACTTIGTVADFLDGRRVPLKDADRAVRQGPYPYYGASGVIDRIDDYLFDEELLLVSEDGANLVDRSTPIAFLASGKYWVNNHAHVLRAVHPYTNFLLAEYLEGLNLEPFITGTAQPKLNKAACESITIPRPPNKELVAIERQLRASAESVHTCEKRFSEIEALLRFALAELIGSSAGDQS